MLKHAVNARLHVLRSLKQGQFGGLQHRVENLTYGCWNPVAGERQLCCSLEQESLLRAPFRTVGPSIRDAVRLRMRLGTIADRLVYYGGNANAISRRHFQKYGSSSVRKSIR